jgi:tRNA A37 threonylcarbamoyltransferase TsaD
MSTLPTARELQAQIAQAEGEKASAALKAQLAADAERQAFLDRISKPSGLSDDQVLEKASHIIARAASNGLTSVQVFRFPNHLCTDNGRMIDQAEQGWEVTLTGIPRELYEFWGRQLKPRGYHIKYEVIDRPKGIRGDIAVFLSWS